VPVSVAQQFTFQSLLTAIPSSSLWSSPPNLISGASEIDADATFGGPSAKTFTKHKNSDIENGKIKPSAPPAQLYDLENDLSQTKNLYREYPEVVEEMKALLDSYRPAVSPAKRP
jgi:hypothetical protein